MNDGEWIGKIHSSMDRQCKARGYAAPVDVLMDPCSGLAFWRKPQGNSAP